MEQLLMSIEDTFTRENKTYAVANGHIEITLPGTSAVIMREIS
jgi:hypothetical protein